MSKPAFTWTPDLGAQRSVKPRVNPIKFGDGYEQRVATGINFKPKVWSVTFSKAPSETQDILAFLDARGGLESFTWVDPLNESGTYVCREWSVNQKVFGVYEVSATFEQVYEF